MNLIQDGFILSRVGSASGREMWGNGARCLEERVCFILRGPEGAVTTSCDGCPGRRALVEMCAIYKYGNDDVLRMNAFFSLSFLFDAFCFHLI